MNRLLARPLLLALLVPSVATADPDAGVPDDAVAEACAQYAIADPGLRPLSYETGWFGNTTHGAPHGDPTAIHVPTRPGDIEVHADGTIYFAAHYDEAQEIVQVYDASGTQLADVDTLGNNGGDAITSDATAMYAALTVQAGDSPSTRTNANGLPIAPPANQTWFTVARYDQHGAPLPFAAGTGPRGNLLVIATRPSASIPALEPTAVAGLAIGAQRLYVSNALDGRIETHALPDLSLVPGGSTPLPRCDRLALDAAGTLWALQTANETTTPPTAATIARIASPGAAAVTAISFDPTADPSDLALDAHGMMYVADAGPHENVALYDTAHLAGSPTRPVGTLGVEGGVLAGPVPGAIGPARFHDLLGVGVDGAGNVYVVEGSIIDATVTSRLSRYTRTATGYERAWLRESLAFRERGSFDDGRIGDVYTRDKHFVYDPASASDPHWYFAGYTLDDVHMPEDPRLHDEQTMISIREIDGHRVMYQPGHPGQLAIFRFDTAHGEIAVPSGFIAYDHVIGIEETVGHGTRTDTTWPPNQPTTGAWIWRDRDLPANQRFDADEYTSLPGSASDAGTGSGSIAVGEGWSVDSRGDIWTCNETTLVHFHLLGFDAQGNPLYDFGAAGFVQTPVPAPFIGADRTGCNRVTYVPETDTMYLAGSTPANPALPRATALPGTYGPAGSDGTTLARYDHWTHGPGAPTWTTLLPTNVVARGLTVAGDYLFLGMVALHTPGWVRVYDATDGTRVGDLTPGATVGCTTGLFDIRDPVEAIHEPSGRYTIMAEDDYDMSVVVYRWVPPGVVLVDAGTTTDGSAATDGATALDASSDASVALDAGPVPSGGSHGCGCRVAANVHDGARPVGMLATFALGVFVRRRRRSGRCTTGA